jgi:hypothetical protein
MESRQEGLRSSKEALFRRRALAPALKLRTVRLCLIALVGIGCGAPAFPTKELSIQATHVPVPVMLSLVAHKKEGRSTSARGGFDPDSLTPPAGEGPSGRLADEVRKGDQWIQIEGAEFTGTDEVWADPMVPQGHSMGYRSLVLQAAIH